MLFREPWESKEVYLFKLYNKGAVDLRLCYNYERDGVQYWSRWIRYDYLMSLSADERVHGTIDTKEGFIKKASHRTIHPLEIVYDIDEPEYTRQTRTRSAGSTLIVIRDRKYPNIKSLSKRIYLRLGESYIKKAYFTGNKSYHLHQYRPEYSLLSARERELRREDLLWWVGADVQKKSENAMIAIELEPHYRSGKPKEEVCEWEAGK